MYIPMWGVPRPHTQRSTAPRHASFLPRPTDATTHDLPTPQSIIIMGPRARASGGSGRTATCPSRPAAPTRASPRWPRSSPCPWPGPSPAPPARSSPPQTAPARARCKFGLGWVWGGGVVVVGGLVGWLVGWSKMDDGTLSVITHLGWEMVEACFPRALPLSK